MSMSQQFLLLYLNKFSKKRLFSLFTKSEAQNSLLNKQYMLLKKDCHQVKNFRQSCNLQCLTYILIKTFIAIKMFTPIRVI